MFPEFLEGFEEELKKYRLDPVKITAIPLEGGESTGITQSKFSGMPYLPHSVAYPRDLEGLPMILLAQINYEELPEVADHPTTGVIQFFVSADWTDLGMDAEKDKGRTKVLFHPDTTADHQTDFSFITEDLLADSPFMCEHKLEFVKEAEYGGLEDNRFDFSFDGTDGYEYSEELGEELGAEFDDFFETDGHKIGGYAYFVQGDPREGDKVNDVPLLQMDSDEKIIIGDAGVLHFFISKEDLRKRNFDKAYFQWDCL